MSSQNSIPEEEVDDEEDVPGVDVRTTDDAVTA